MLALGRAAEEVAVEVEELCFEPLLVIERDEAHVIGHGAETAQARVLFDALVLRAGEPDLDCVDLNHCEYCDVCCLEHRRRDVVKGRHARSLLLQSENKQVVAGRWARPSLKYLAPLCVANGVRPFNKKDWVDMMTLGDGLARCLSIRL